MIRALALVALLLAGCSATPSPPEPTPTSEPAVSEPPPPLQEFALEPTSEHVRRFPTGSDENFSSRSAVIDMALTLGNTTREANAETEVEFEVVDAEVIGSLSDVDGDGWTCTGDERKVICTSAVTIEPGSTWPPLAFTVDSSAPMGGTSRLKIVWGDYAHEASFTYDTMV